MEYKNKTTNEIKQADKYREWIGGCQRGGWWVINAMGEGGQKVQPSSCKISHGGVS